MNHFLKTTILTLSVLSLGACANSKGARPAAKAVVPPAAAAKGAVHAAAPLESHQCTVTLLDKDAKLLKSQTYCAGHTASGVDTQSVEDQGVQFFAPDVAITVSMTFVAIADEKSGQVSTFTAELSRRQADGSLQSLMKEFTYSDGNEFTSGETLDRDFQYTVSCQRVAVCE